MNKSIVFLMASPSPTSRSAFVARTLAAETERGGVRPAFWSLSDFDPGDVLFGRGDAREIAPFIVATKEAAGIVLATPVYKAVYTGALKAIVDLIPPDNLAGKPALGIATAKQPGHATTVDQAYRSLFAFFKARPQDTLFLRDDEVQLGPGAGVLAIDAEQRLRKAARALVQATAETAQAAL